ncbi:MAG: hypothetical protein O7J95_20725 [Planctomycetota bacterium]|nr:hypothetical protein [Planctomycetota bacterium]
MEATRRWYGPGILLILCSVGLSACRTAAPRPPIARVAGEIGANQISARVEEANYQLAEEPTRDVDRDGPAPSALPETPEGDESFSLPPTLPLPLEDLTVDELVDEMEERLRDRLEETVPEGGAVSGEGATVGPGRDRADLVRALVALNFLKPRMRLLGIRPTTVEVLRGAGEEDVESRLLAAAYLERTGFPELRDEVLRDLGSRRPGDDSVDRYVLRIERLTFATDIEGFRRYTVRPSIFSPGEEVRIYGEFSGYRTGMTHAEDEDSGEAGTPYCRVRGVLSLVDAEGKVVDSGPFLGGKATILTRDRPRQSINFWARYRLSPGLPAGDYRLRVSAEDLEGSQETVAELPLTLASPPQPPAE